MIAPMANSANKSPMIKSKRGAKFEICAFAFAVKSVTKFVGNSIMYRKGDGPPF
jgi:uncharacterized membrane protein